MRLYTFATFVLGCVAGSAGMTVPVWPAIAVVLALLIVALVVADLIATDFAESAP